VIDEARLFVAAELPEGVRGELVRWTRHSVAAGSGARRLEVQSLNLTVCFLGQQPLACVPELAGVLGGLAEALSTVGELVVGAPVWLPPRRPRAIAVEIGDSDGGLHALRAALAADLEATIDWRPGRQRFRPHVTVARLRADARPPAALPPTPPLRFACERVVLLRSHLERDGARYEELASVGGW
jgi:2'-5' RNA ligase